MKAAEPQCPYCHQSFVPSRFQPEQRICSRAACQRRRRREYHRAHVEADSEYREVCRDSRRKWRDCHPDYQKQYRERHPAYVEANRQAQRRRDAKRRLGDLVKNNSAFDVKRWPGEVWLLGSEGADLVKNTLAFAQVTIFQSAGRSSPRDSGIL